MVNKIEDETTPASEMEESNFEREISSESRVTSVSV
jgi:hypothetical protein